MIIMTKANDYGNESLIQDLHGLTQTKKLNSSVFSLN